MKTKIITSVKGLVIGASMLIPGLSGGTIAIILGIYDKLIHAIGTITDRTKLKENLTFLLTFMCGACVGIYLFSKIVLSVINFLGNTVLFLFIGIIIASIYPLYKKTTATRLEKKDFIYILIGMSTCFLTILLPNDIITLKEEFSVLNLFIFAIAGIIIAVALIFPGLSVSQMLLLLGLYKPILAAITTKSFTFIMPLAISVGIGTLLTANILEKFITNKPRPTYFIIIGFVIGSAIEAIPENFASVNIILAILLLIAGFLSMMYISKKRV